MVDEKLERIRSVCLALPEATEGEGPRPTFRVREKTFVWYMDNHHDDGRLAIWCKAPAGEQAALVQSDPQRFFVPPYVGPKGWIGVRLEGKVDWDELFELIEESYRLMAPRRLLAQLEQEHAAAAGKT